MATNMEQGKAFEFACLLSLDDQLRRLGVKTSIIDDNAYRTARHCYEDKMTTEQQRTLDSGADTASRLIMPLEPRLFETGLLTFKIAADAAGIGSQGDVRDVLCARGDGWEIGLSCKHNHEALKHPRITRDKDFGRDWMGIPCSVEYMQEITPTINKLAMHGGDRRLWRDIPDAWDEFYIPILQAYRDELLRICRRVPEAPTRLLSYFFGSRDFYKVIMMARTRTTKIEAFNMHGSLSLPSGRRKPVSRIPVTRFPGRLLLAEIRPGTKTTLDLTFDGGWAISMRLHNKDSVCSPTSLAWDVNLQGLPPSMYINTHSWVI